MIWLCSFILDFKLQSIQENYPRLVINAVISEWKKLRVATLGLEEMPFANAFTLFPEIIFYRIILVLAIVQIWDFGRNISTHECQSKWPEEENRDNDVCSYLASN